MKQMRHCLLMRMLCCPCLLPLRTIGRRNTKIIQGFRIVKHDQLSFRNALYVARQLFGKTTGEYFLRFFAGKRFDHADMITSQDIIVKG
jgi:hypothetical protein